MTASTAASNDHHDHHDHGRDRGHHRHDEHDHDDHDHRADQGHEHEHGHDDELVEGHTPRGPIERLVLGAINLYRLTAPARMPRCRYIPSCSAYAVEAVEVHGLARGAWLALCRLGRCHPFGSFGFDPVPERADQPPDEPSGSANPPPEPSTPPERT